MFGSLSELSIKTEEHGYRIYSPGAEFSPPDRPLIDVPQIITKISTEYKGYPNGRHPIAKVSCLSDDDIWTCGNDSIIRLYNLQRKLVMSI